MAFFVYLLRCADGSYYTGHTDNLEMRLGEHAAGAGSDWTRSRLPVEHVWSQDFVTREEALVAERRIKGWSRAKKEALISGEWEQLSLLAKARTARPSTSSGRTDRSRSELPVRGEPVEPRTDLHVERRCLNAILEHTNALHPHECCGLLLGENDTVTRAQATANVHPEPARHFEIDPKALIAAHKAERAGGPQVIGYYHSHPTGDPQPSATDRAQAAHDGKVWAIVGQNEIRFFRDGEEGFAALSYRVLPR